MPAIEVSNDFSVKYEILNMQMKKIDNLKQKDTEISTHSMLKETLLRLMNTPLRFYIHK